MKPDPAHIVIVEDDPVTRAKLAAYFSTAGYRVSEAEDGEQMRDILADHPADLLMIDINLPGEDGLQLTREQRERSEVGIILVTGRTDTVDRIVGLEIGADDYVTKPFDQRELLARVKNLLRRGLLSDERYVEMRLNARSSRYGNARLAHELRIQGVADELVSTALAGSEGELSRAQQVWQRKFGNPTTDPADRARQMRFLMSRGFSGETTRRVLRGNFEDD